MSEPRWSKTGWPVDEDDKRTDPIGRYLESLTPEQRRAWGATCSEDVPRVEIEGGNVRVVYPWERSV